MACSTYWSGLHVINGGQSFSVTINTEPGSYFTDVYAPAYICDDPGGVQGSASYDVDWGDGTSHSTGTVVARSWGYHCSSTDYFQEMGIEYNLPGIADGSYDPTSGALNLVHSYSDVGTYTITETIGSLSGTITVTVEGFQIVENSAASGDALDYVGSKTTLSGKMISSDANANITKIDWTVTGPDGNDGVIESVNEPDEIVGYYPLGYEYITKRSWTDTNPGGNTKQLDATQYYWGNIDGNYLVTAKFYYHLTSGDDTKTEYKTITIKVPTINPNTSFGNTDKTSFNAPDGSTYNLIFTGFVGPPRQQLGIESTLTVPSNQSLGTNAFFAVIQIIRGKDPKTGAAYIRNKLYRQTGKQWTAKSSYANPNGSVDQNALLDCGTSTHPPFYPDSYVQYDKNNGSNVILNDYPYSSLASGETALSVSIVFDCYLMFSPGGGKIVPIMYMDWAWGGYLERMADGSINLKNKTNPQFFPESWTYLSRYASGSVAAVPKKPDWLGDVRTRVVGGKSHPLPVANINDPYVFDESYVVSYALDIAYDYYVPIAKDYTSRFNLSSFNSYVHPFGMSDLPSDLVEQVYNAYKYNSTQQFNNDLFNNYIYTENDISDIVSRISIGVIVEYCYSRFVGVDQLIGGDIILGS